MHQRTVSVRGEERSYVTSVPDGVAEALPVIVALHGKGDNGRDFLSGTGLGRARAIVAAPTGVGLAWSPAPYARTTFDEDAAFVRALIDDLRFPAIEPPTQPLVVLRCALYQRKWGARREPGRAIQHHHGDRVCVGAADVVPDRAYRQVPYRIPRDELAQVIAPAHGDLRPAPGGECAGSGGAPTLIHGTDDVDRPPRSSTRELSHGLEEAARSCVIRRKRERGRSRHDPKVGSHAHNPTQRPDCSPQWRDWL